MARIRLKFQKRRFLAWPPMAVLDSRRAAGKHLYYADTEGRGNGHFEVYGCAGEIRSAKGYLILWHDGAGHLADALHDPVARSRRWPRDLFELAGVGAVTLPRAVKTPAYSYKPSDQSRQTWAAAAAALELETIKRGLRNVKLFDSVRFWAYSVLRGQDLEAWTRRVRIHALEQNRRFPEPVPGGSAGGCICNTHSFEGGGMPAFLHRVTGSAEYCGPCALSALTGWPSETWPDKPMGEWEGALYLERARLEQEAPWYVDSLRNHLAGVGLAEFCQPGRWALTVKLGNGEAHTVAVAVQGKERVLADNNIREPLPLATVLDRHEFYRDAVVVCGFQLVPDTPIRFTA